MTTRPLQFLRRGQPVALGNVPPDRTLLEVLREDLGCTGTKEGCAEGDCGACTVVLGEADGHGKVRYSAVNSCIRLAHSIDGMALWTAEDLAEDPLIQPVVTSTQPRDSSALHPVQEAMVQCHGSQCGFCTPGFVMSLFGMYQNRVCQGQSISRAQAAQDLSGNLCRCTGYRPILDAAQQMAQLPPMAVNEAELLQKLELLALTPQAPEANLAYIAPATQADLLAARQITATLSLCMHAAAVLQQHKIPVDLRCRVSGPLAACDSQRPRKEPGSCHRTRSSQAGWPAEGIRAAGARAQAFGRRLI